MTGERRSEDSDQEEQASNSPSSIDFPAIISYNLREGERPDGIKVRMETGRKAAVAEARQAEVMKELLGWARQHRTRQQDQ